MANLATTSFVPDLPAGYVLSEYVVQHSGVFTGVNGYVTTGWDLTSFFPKGRTLSLVFFHQAADTRTYWYDRLNHTLYAIVRSTGVEVASGVDLSALTGRYSALILRG